MTTHEQLARLWCAQIGGTGNPAQIAAIMAELSVETLRALLALKETHE